MKGILADINVIGHVEALVQILEGEYWHELWKELGLLIFTFQDLGLEAAAPDSLLWNRCQEFEVVLITGNRNADDPESLEVTIRRESTATSLPVFTLADTERIRNDREYAELTAEVLLDYLMHIENIRGTGRLFLP